jgi:hypothetical protein
MQAMVSSTQRHSTYVQDESTITAMPIKRLDPSADAHVANIELDDFDVVLLT